MQSLAALAHYDYNAAGAYSYEQAIQILRQVGLSGDEIEQQFRRTVFNVVARNQDDHVKNIALLMDRHGNWSLSPAFDVVYAHSPTGAWTSRHQMSVSGKCEGLTRDDLLEFGRFCNIKATRARRIIAEVVDAVRDWPSIAADVGVGEVKIDAVAGAHRVESMARP
jgi:serine/threonine-protein kinase HipA